jgi:hypothetical protein
MMRFMIAEIFTKQNFNIKGKPSRDKQDKVGHFLIYDLRFTIGWRVNWDRVHQSEAEHATHD